MKHPRPGYIALRALHLLDAEELATLEAHLAECAACRELVADEDAALAPAPGDAPGHIPAEVIAQWERAVADFGAVERGLYASHLATCAQCVAILRRLGHDPGLVSGGTVAHRRPSASRVSRRWLGMAAAGAAVLAAVLLGQLMIVSTTRPPAPGAPTVARGPEVAQPVTPGVAPVKPGVTTPPAPHSATPPASPGTVDTFGTPQPTPTQDIPPVPPATYARGVQFELQSPADRNTASPVLATALLRAVGGTPGLEAGHPIDSDPGRFIVQATVTGDPARAGDASRPAPGGPRGTIAWELVDRYTGERVLVRTAMLDSSQAGAAAARMAGQVSSTIARIPWAGRVRSAESSRVEILDARAGAAAPAVGDTLVLYARGRERIDAVTGVVEGYEWIPVGRARVIGTNEYGIAAEPFDIKRGSPTLKDAVLARIQGPQ